jgi:hypothetical protein
MHQAISESSRTFAFSCRDLGNDNAFKSDPL